MSVLGNEAGLMSSFISSEELGDLMDEVSILQTTNPLLASYADVCLACHAIFGEERLRDKDYVMSQKNICIGGTALHFLPPV